MFFLSNDRPPRVYYRVAFDASKISRSGAWAILQRQQIPGCPDTGRNHWAKDHVYGREWAWVYPSWTVITHWAPFFYGQEPL